MPLPSFPFKFASSSSSRRIIFTATRNTVIFITTSNSIYAVIETCSYFYSTFGWSDQTSEWNINVGQTPYAEIVTYIPAIIPICYQWWQSCWSTYLNLPHPTRGVAAIRRRTIPVMVIMVMMMMIVVKIIMLMKKPKRPNIHKIVLFPQQAAAFYRERTMYLRLRTERLGFLSWNQSKGRSGKKKNDILQHTKDREKSKNIVYLTKSL